MVASDSIARSASTLAISGWSASFRPKAVRWAAWCAAIVTPARIPVAVPSTQSSRVMFTISMMVRTPRPSSPTSQASGLVVLDLGRRVRPVAELVLQPLQVHAVPGAVRPDPGQQEAGQPAGRLGEHHEQVAHRRRGEPLVPGQQVAPSPPTPRRLHRDGAGGVRPDVRAALLLGHRHAREQAPLGLGRAQAEVVLRGREQRLEALGQAGRVPQRGHDGIGHRDRAAVPGLGRAPDVEARRPRHVRAGAGIPPRRGVQAVPHRHRHQLMPGRVELHLVDPVAEAVVRAQPRRVLVGLAAVLLRLRRAGQAAEFADAVLGPAAPSRRSAASMAGSSATSYPVSAGGWLNTSCVGGISGSWLGLPVGRRAVGRSAASWPCRN